MRHFQVPELNVQQNLQDTNLHVIASPILLNANVTLWAILQKI